MALSFCLPWSGWILSAPPSGSPPRSDALLLATLREHPPFDELEADSLDFIAARLRLAYYARGQAIVGPESGPAERLYIVKQGRARGSAGSAATRAAADVALGAGEMFPISALIERRAVVYAYRADEDTFCWELPAAQFHALLERSTRFRAFCTGHLAALVARSHRALRAELGEGLVDSASMLATLRSAIVRAPVSCPPETPVGEVLKAMQAERVGSMVIADAGGRPLGIFTTVDALDYAASSKVARDAPIAGLMSRKPIALEEKATLADAALAMARHGIRHVIVTRDAKLTGVVSERDLFALQRVSLRRTAERIGAAHDREQLAEAAQDVRQLARHLLAQGIAAEPLTAMISALNDALSLRVIELAAARRSLPGQWCWLALGSEGRNEQTFATDQDNALIVDSGKELFLELADEVNRDLEACGFPLCKGGIMARNPRWCLTLPEWRAVFDGWIRAPQPEALLNASIFFDFRPIAGDGRLAGALREPVLAQTRAHAAFCRAMAEVALRVRPPLGLLRDFTEKQIDLKISGARPFVDAARVLALAGGDAETSTAARLRARGEADAVEAFHYIQGLRLRHGNLVRVDSLNAIDQRILKEAFRQGALLQERLRVDYTL